MGNQSGVDLIKGVGDDIKKAWEETFEKLGIEFGYDVPKEWLDLVLTVTTVPPGLVNQLLKEMKDFNNFTVATSFGDKTLTTTITLLGDVKNHFPEGEIPDHILEIHKTSTEKAFAVRDSFFELILAAAKISKLVL